MREEDWHMDVNNEARVQETITVSGTVESIIYRNDENAYTVCAVASSETGRIFTAFGSLPFLTEGDEITATGKWTVHKKYGKQFAIETFERKMPETNAEIVKYLSSGIIKGVGQKTAEKIVEKFGADTFEVIENNPEWLADIKGIKKGDAEEIGRKFRELSASHEFVLYCSDLMPITTSMKLFKLWGDNAMEKLRTSPYELCLANVGVGFKKADSIALSVGIDEDSPVRIKAGIMYILSNEGNRSGHTCLPEDELIFSTVQLLFRGNENYVPAVNDAMKELIKERTAVSVTKDGRGYIFSAEAYDAEKYIAEKLIQINRYNISFDSADVEILMKKSEMFSGLRYVPLQAIAIKTAVTSGAMVLTGGPGTGKTTIIKGLIDIFDSAGMSVCLAAPTGRAAKRMSESTSYEAKTIHRLLETERTENDEPVFARNASNPLDEEVIIIDEASMIDIYLMRSLLEAIRKGSKIILIGDADQLPSVGCGNVLEDIINSGVINVIRLNEIFRQSEHGTIILNSHKINSGEMPDISASGKDFFLLERKNDTDIPGTIEALITKRLPKAYGESISDMIQVISPSRKGDAGTETLNALLQASLNPPDASKKEITVKGGIYREGDRIMQTKNDYSMEWVTPDGSEGAGVYNGDIGTITAIGDNTVEVTFDDRICEYDPSTLDETEHAYAITVHKSQGSEYPVVIFPLYNCSYMLQTRNLLYTAVTRATKMVILVGKKSVLETMVGNDNRTKRCTMLSDFLIAAASNS